MNHHPSSVIVERYGSGALDAATSVSVELHLDRCAVCRAAVNATVPPSRFDDNWFMIVAELDAPRRGFLERAMVRLGMGADTARLMAATPSMRRSWYLAIAGVVLFGMSAAAPNRPNSSILLFLALAPLIPVIGVGLAYGRGVDPSYEITVSTPVSGFRLVLLRASAVLAASIGIAGIASLLMVRRETLLVGAWLVPALALSAVCLALSTFLAPRLAAGIVTGCWLGAILLVSGNPENGADQLIAFRPAGQAIVALCGVIALIVVVVRRRTFDLASAGVTE